MSALMDKLRVEDDGLICPEIGAWSEDKYRLIALYDGLFATGMKGKWDMRVYIDLYLWGRARMHQRHGYPTDGVSTHRAQR